MPMTSALQSKDAVCAFQITLKIPKEISRRSMLFNK